MEPLSMFTRLLTDNLLDALPFSIGGHATDSGTAGPAADAQKLASPCRWWSDLPCSESGSLVDSSTETSVRRESFANSERSSVIPSWPGDDGCECIATASGS